MMVKQKEIWYNPYGTVELFDDSDMITDFKILFKVKCSVYIVWGMINGDNDKVGV